MYWNYLLFVAKKILQDNSIEIGTLNNMILKPNLLRVILYFSKEQFISL